jgi:ribonuclease Z
LNGRTKALYVYGLTHTIDRMEKMMALYDWNEWPGFYPVHFVRVPEEERQKVLSGKDVCVTGSPVKHLLPTLGLRFDFLTNGKSAAISSDTEPTEAMVRLSKDVDVLIHEATGASRGHSSAEQAGSVAQQAQARALWLIHYTPGEDTDHLIEQAGKMFAGPVYIARELDKIDLS